MNFSDLIIPGYKIDVRLAQMVNREKNGKYSDDIHLYRSGVTDVLSPTEIEISMPTLGTKMVLFEVGVRLDLIFYGNGTLYHCQGIVEKRYKKEILYLLCVRQITDLEKFQRREFFRIGKYQDMKYYPISEDVAGLRTTAELYQKTLEPEYIMACSYANILDISGGGIRFSTSSDVEEDGYILTDFHLQNKKVDKKFFLVNQIIAVDKAPADPDKRIVRSKFWFKSPADRETIVQYVYEEERRMRRSEDR